MLTDIKFDEYEKCLKCSKKTNHHTGMCLACRRAVCSCGRMVMVGKTCWKCRKPIPEFIEHTVHEECGLK